MGRSTAASGGRHRENRGGSEIKRTEKCSCGFTRNGNIRILSAVNPEIVVGELGNASITKIVYDGKTFTVESVNDMSYVKDME